MLALTLACACLPLLALALASARPCFSLLSQLLSLACLALTPLAQLALILLTLAPLALTPLTLAQLALPLLALTHSKPPKSVKLAKLEKLVYPPHLPRRLLLEIGKTVLFQNGIPFFSPETETVFDLWMTFRISVSVKNTDKKLR